MYRYGIKSGVSPFYFYVSRIYYYFLLLLFRINSEMRSFTLLIQSTLLLGAFVAGDYSQSSIYDRKNQVGRTVAEFEVLNRVLPTMKLTPEQKIAADRKAAELKSLHDRQNAKKNRHPDLVLHKEGSFTDEEKQRMTVARNTAIEESKVHTDESKYPPPECHKMLHLICGLNYLCYCIFYFKSFYFLIFFNFIIFNF
jgi:hypothetical protein